jgi:hypothetical protein
VRENNIYVDIPFTAHDPFLVRSKAKDWKANNPNSHGNKKTKGPNATIRTIIIKT